MKVYFAGIETCSASYNLNIKRGDNIFCTYFYKNKTDVFLDKISINKGHKGLITIDSGAHSFFGYTGNSTAAHHNNKVKKEMPDPNIYFEKYIEWIKTNYDKASYFVELDIQSIVGMEKVWRWRQRYIDEGVMEKIIMVLHSYEGIESLDQMLRMARSGYIGLEGLRAKKINLPYTKILKRCIDEGVKVHGFALTDANIASKYPFYSVDSTTWTAPVRYGTIIILENGKLKQVAPTKENYLKHKISPDEFKVNKSKKASTMKLNFAMNSQRQYEAYLKNLWEKRGVKWT